MIDNKIQKTSSVSIILFGSLLILINAGINPFLNTDGIPFYEVAQTTLFLIRQSLSALAALLFSIGIVGLYLKQSKESGSFGFLSFLVALTGSILLFAHEWRQVFFVTELASISPDTLLELDSSSKSTVAAISAFLGFTLGCIMFSISTLSSKVYSKAGPSLIIAGFIVIPLLSALLGGLLGSVLGNIVLGSGFFLLGKELYFSEKERSF